MAACAAEKALAAALPQLFQTSHLAVGASLRVVVCRSRRAIATLPLCDLRRAPSSSFGQPSRARSCFRPSEKVPAQLVPDVESFGTDPQKHFIPETRLGWGVSTIGWKMIAHQTIGMPLPLGLDATLAQRLERLPAIPVVPENILALAHTLHHVINRPAIPEAQLTRPGKRIATGVTSVIWKCSICCGTIWLGISDGRSPKK